MKKVTLLFAAIILMVLTSNIFAQGIPETINYQGILKDAAGVVVPNGDYNLTFKLYDVESGGSSVWSETKLITVASGIVNTQLGSVTPIPQATFNAALWLGITVASGTELTPRIALTSVPYSIYSLNVPDGTITASKIASGEVIKSLNSLKDNVNLVAGTNITITPTGNNLTIASTGGGGGGTVTQVNTGAGLTGGPITTTGIISVPNNGIIDVMLSNNSVTSSKITDGTINAVDIGSSQVLKSLNTLKDNVTLVAGSNITITPSGNNLTIAATGSGSGIGGSGGANYLPLFTNSTTLGNSLIYQTAGNDVGIGTTTPTEKLDVYGDIEFGAASSPIKLKYKVGPTGWWGLTLNVNANEYYSFDRLGTAYFSEKLGIGITQPSYPLHVATNRRTAGYFTSDTLSGFAKVVVGEYLGVGNYDAYGVYGASTPADGYGFGGYFSGGYRGVYGFSNGNAYTGTVAGVYGYSQGGTVGTRVGVYGSASGGATTWAGYFSGNVNVAGTLSKGAGSFKIDHPLDPTNKYLYHSFVESPDMMNIYNGNVITDATGYAIITMPNWFEALNQDFRYQLTVIGEFAQAIVSQKIQNNQFIIRTDKPNIEVSWQVTGVRHDKFAEKYRIPVEENKRPEDVGKYLHPDAYGVSETMGVDYEMNNSNRDRR